MHPVPEMMLVGRGWPWRGADSGPCHRTRQIGKFKVGFGKQRAARTKDAKTVSDLSTRSNGHESLCLSLILRWKFRQNIVSAECSCKQPLADIWAKISTRCSFSWPN